MPSQHHTANKGFELRIDSVWTFGLWRHVVGQDRACRETTSVEKAKNQIRVKGMSLQADMLKFKEPLSQGN